MRRWPGSQIDGRQPTTSINPPSVDPAGSGSEPTEKVRHISLAAGEHDPGRDQQLSSACPTGRRYRADYPQDCAGSRAARGPSATVPDRQTRDAIEVRASSRRTTDFLELRVVRAGDGKKFGMLTILLIILIVLVLAGGFGYGGGTYRTGGIGLAGLLLIILLVLLLTGAL